MINNTVLIINYNDKTYKVKLVVSKCYIITIELVISVNTYYYCYHYHIYIIIKADFVRDGIFAIKIKIKVKLILEPLTF